jgi:hypothetical protein
MGKQGNKMFIGHEGTDLSISASIQKQLQFLLLAQNKNTCKENYMSL